MGVLLIDAEPVLDLIHRHLDQFLIKLLEIRRADPVYPFSGHLISGQIQDALTNANQVFDVPVLQIHLFEGVQFIIHHILKNTKNCLTVRPDAGQIFPQP